MTFKQAIVDAAFGNGPWTAVVFYSDYSEGQPDWNKARERMILSSGHKVEEMPYNGEGEMPDPDTIVYTTADFGGTGYYVHEGHPTFWQNWDVDSVEEDALRAIHDECETQHLVDDWCHDHVFEGYERLSERWQQYSYVQRLHTVRLAIEIPEARAEWADWHTFLKVEDDKVFLRYIAEEVRRKPAAHTDFDGAMSLFIDGAAGAASSMRALASIKLVEGSSISGPLNDPEVVSLLIKQPEDRMDEVYDAYSRVLDETRIYSSGEAGPGYRYKELFFHQSDDVWLVDNNLPEEITNEILPS